MRHHCAVPFTLRRAAATASHPPPPFTGGARGPAQGCAMADRPFPCALADNVQLHADCVGLGAESMGNRMPRQRTGQRAGSRGRAQCGSRLFLARGGGGGQNEKGRHPLLAGTHSTSYPPKEASTHSRTDQHKRKYNGKKIPAPLAAGI